MNTRWMLHRPAPAERPTRRFAVLAAVVAGSLLAALLPQALLAQDAYPSRAIRLILPFGAGGLADIHSRLTATELTKRLGQPIVVENQPGGFGIPAARSALEAPRDGYTVTLFANGTATAVSLLKDLTFDPVNDFVPISNVVYFEFLIVANAKSKYRTLQDLIAAAKARPGSLNIGTTARGSSSNLAAELFKTSAGIDITVVTYRNPPEMVTALLRNDVDAVLDSFTVFNSGLQAGTVRALATTGANRSAVLPDVPTVQESGLKDFEVTSWNGWFAAAGTPPAAIGRLNKELNVVMALPGLRQKLLAMGFEAHAGTPQELHERLKADIKRWATVIARAGIEKR